MELPKGLQGKTEELCLIPSVLFLLLTQTKNLNDNVPNQTVSRLQKIQDMTDPCLNSWDSSAAP